MSLLFFFIQINQCLIENNANEMVCCFIFRPVRFSKKLTKKTSAVPIKGVSFSANDLIHCDKNAKNWFLKPIWIEKKLNIPFFYCPELPITLSDQTHSGRNKVFNDYLEFRSFQSRANSVICYNPFFQVTYFYHNVLFVLFTRQPSVVF